MPDIPDLRIRLPECRVQIYLRVGVHHAKTVRPNHPHSVLVAHLHHFIFRRFPFRAGLREPGRNRNYPPHPFLPALLNHFFDRFFWHDHNCQIHGVRHIEDSGVRFHGVDHGRFGVDRKHLAVELGGEDIVKSFTTNSPFAGRCSDHGDRCWPENIVQFTFHIYLSCNHLRSRLGR